MKLLTSLSALSLLSLCLFSHHLQASNIPGDAGVAPEYTGEVR